MRFLPNSLPSDDKKETLLQILTLILLVLVVYYRAVSGTVVSIDDAGIIKFYGSGRLSLLDVLRPGEGYYYRPVVALNFFFDHWLLGQNVPLLHLENILIHAANTVLVFLLASRLLAPSATRLPFFAALFFAVHPANCEAVSWIAGRTDPLAALFVLLAAIFLCRGLESGKLRHTVLSVGFILVGVLAKETAILFIPASLLLVAFWRHLRPGGSQEALRLQARALCLLYLVICLAAGALFVSRVGQHNSIAKLLTGNKNDAFGSLLLCLRVFGFYLKKMVVPWPLNFAITKVAAWYLFPGATGLVVLCFAPKRNPFFVSLAIGFLFLLPAVAVGLFDVAWTLVAERYLYIPSAFLCIALTGYLHGAAQRLRLQNLVFPVFYLCAAAAAVSTLQRTRLWQSNLTLFQDAVAQSPEFGMLHNELAVALAKDGRIAEANHELDVASSLQISDLVKGLIRKNRLLIRVMKAEPAEVRRAIDACGVQKSKEDSDLLIVLRRSDYLRLKDTRDQAERESLVSELLEVSEILYSRSGDPFYLYKIGQLHLVRGERAQAASCFSRCYRAASDDAFYKPAAGRLAATLSRKL